MPPGRPNSLRWWWLLLIPAAAGAVLLAERTLAERRAQEAAISAELLSPFEGAGPVPDGARSEAAPVRPDPSAAPLRRTRSVADSGDLRALVPPELAFALVPDTAEAPPPPPPLDPMLFSEWTTYDDAVAKSRSSGRPILLAFIALRCETCESMREAVFDDVAGDVTIRSAVIPVLVKDLFSDTGDDARLVDDLQKRFGVNSFPTLVVWSPSKNKVKALQGYRGAAMTLRFITDAASAVNAPSH